MAPTVALSAASTVVTTAGIDLLTATVSDAVGVTSVQFFKGSMPLSTPTSATAVITGNTIRDVAVAAAMASAGRCS